MPSGARWTARMKWIRGAAVLTASIATLAACATTSTAARDRAIEQRAQARWNALLAGDYATAHSYAAPGYRSATSATDFEIGYRIRRVQYDSAEYREHRCEERVCTVRMWVGYTIPRPAQGVPEWKSHSIVEERWIEVDGEWWFNPDS